LTPRIGIDYTAAIQQGAGIGRSVRELVGALAATKPSLPLKLFVAGARRAALPPPPGHSTYHPSRLSELNLVRLWHRLNLPIPVEWWTGPLDLFHAPDFTLPPTRRGVKTVLTIHDLAFERYPAEAMPGMLDYLKRVVPRSVRRADRVIAISAATARDLVDVYGTPPEKIEVIPLGVTDRFHPRAGEGEAAAIHARYHLPPGPLILTVGTLQPRKNHLRLVQAFARVAALYSDLTLVIAGAPGWGYEAVEREVAHLGLNDRVVFTGRVDDADLPALYRASTVFAYPALYEGFGLPPLEAMACGVPVLVGNTSSLPEVVEQAGLLVDPFDVDALSAALDQLVGDDALRIDLSQRGIERARQFTWTRAADQTWAVYDTLLRQGTGN
jgi:glycosyltransferase involved in cell wall biosynthesis